MNLLFPSKVNVKKGVASVEDFQPLRKRERIVADLRYLGEGNFQIKASFIRDLETGQGWTCSYDPDSKKVYLVRIEAEGGDIPARFLVKSKDKKSVSPKFKAAVLSAALVDRLDEKNFSLVATEEQPFKNVTLFEITSISDEVDVETEEEAAELDNEAEVEPSEEIVEEQPKEQFIFGQQSFENPLV